jgi:hypothetical protein
MSLAHAGGIDEMLLVLAPTIIFLLLYRLIRGREEAEEPEPSEEDRR